MRLIIVVVAVLHAALALTFKVRNILPALNLLSNSRRLAGAFFQLLRRQGGGSRCRCTTRRRPGHERYRCTPGTDFVVSIEGAITHTDSCKASSSAIIILQFDASSVIWNRSPSRLKTGQVRRVQPSFASRLTGYQPSNALSMIISGAGHSELTKATTIPGVRWNEALLRFPNPL